MAVKRPLLKVHCLSMPQVSTEWGSLLGDKYRQALAFDIELTDDPREAQVIAWDGIVGRKLEALMPEIINLLKDKVLLLTGESTTLMQDSPFVRYVQVEPQAHVDLPGWTILPEDLLASLEACYQKIIHV